MWCREKGEDFGINRCLLISIENAASSGEIVK